MVGWRFRLWLPLLLVLYTARTSHQRTKTLALVQRIDAFYKTHTLRGLNPPDAKTVLKKHGSEHSLDEALKKKYGAGLPPEDLTNLFQEDCVATAAYLGINALERNTRRYRETLANKASEHAQRLSDWADDKVSSLAETSQNSNGIVAFVARAPEFALRGARSMFGIFAIAATRWYAWTPYEQMAHTSAVASIVSVLVPRRARLVPLIGWVMLVFVTIRPPLDVLEPSRLLEVWAKTWGRGLSNRLVLVSWLTLLSLALQPRHTPLFLLLFLVLSAVASVPACTDPLEHMPFVARRARSALSIALKENSDLLQSHSMGIANFVTLHSGRSSKSISASSASWDAPVVAVGAFGKWKALALIDVPSRRASNGRQIDISGILPPAYLLPLGLCLIVLALAAASGASISLFGSRLAQVVLLLQSTIAFALYCIGSNL